MIQGFPREPKRAQPSEPAKATLTEALRRVDPAMVTIAEKIATLHSLVRPAGCTVEEIVYSALCTGLLMTGWVLMVEVEQRNRG